MPPYRLQYCRPEVEAARQPESGIMQPEGGRGIGGIISHYKGQWWGM